MRARIRSFLTFVLHPPAILLAGTSAVAGTLFLFEDALGMLALGGICLGLYLFTALAAHRFRRANQLGAERDRFEADLRQLREIMDVAPVMLWECDPGGSRRWVSPQYLGFTGQRPAEAMGTGWLEVVHPEDRELCKGALRLAAVDHRPFELEYRAQSGDDERWLFDRGLPRFDADGEFVGFVGLTTDVTEWKSDRDEDETSRRLLRLSDSIHTRVVDLVDRYETAEERRQQTAYAERVKGEFLRALSEELQVPVEELHNVSQLLAREEIPPRLEGFITRIRAAAEGLFSLLERAVNLRKLDEHVPELEPGRFNLRRLIEQMAERHSAFAADRSLRVKVEVGDFVPTLVKADPMRVRRLLHEMWVVVLRLARSGRVSFRATRESKSMSIARLQFAITHSADEVDWRLVDRASYPTDPLDGSAGLGFGLCRDLAVMLGGDAGVMRDDDKTVTFWANVSVEEVTSHWHGRRTHGRLALESVSSNLGEVLDLSLGGMRVQVARPPESPTKVVLSDPEEEIELNGKVAWSKRRGFGKHEIGIEFTDVAPEQATRLSRLATRNRIRRVFEAA
jgi:PAS domain S-box-containing protein